MTHRENIEAADALVEYAAWWRAKGTARGAANRIAAEVARARTREDTDPARSWTAAPSAAEAAADEARRKKYLSWLE